MSTKDRPLAEKRHPVCCATCGTPMVCMNKYIVSEEDENKTYMWYVCPRRKGDNEKGCGHKTLIEIKRNAVSPGEAELLVGFRLAGEVRFTDKVAMIIQENLETFETWLQHNRDKFRDKRVEIVMRLIEENES